MAAPVPGMPPGMQLTPQQMQQMQQQFLADAQRLGLTPQQYAEKLKAHAMAQQAAQQRAQRGEQAPEAEEGEETEETPETLRQLQQMQQQQRVPIAPGPPKPEALAVAKFLRSQELKARTCMLQEQRKELFKVKRALRALQSPAYTKAQQKKNSLLPPITDRASAEGVFKLLPMSMLALRVSRITDEDEGKFPHGHPQHVHKPKGGQKGVWHVKVEPQQDTEDQFHYIWLYEGSQWKQKLYAIGALLAVFAVVMYPLWPLFLRKGVWYLSVASLGLLAAFFGLAIVRLIIFIVTIVAGPQPGIWIFPNLFEDVGFFDSFKPTWAWRETKESLAIKKAEKREKRLAKKRRRAGLGNGPATATSTPASKKSAPTATAAATAPSANAPAASGAEVVSQSSQPVRRSLKASVEEAEDE